MWFPSFDRLDAALKALMTRVGEVQLTTEGMLKDSKVLVSVLGPAVELQNFYDKGETLLGVLLNIMTGLRSGAASIRQINVRMPTATAMVKQHEEMLRVLQSARAAGAAQADNFFESKNA